jgi:hypothetical protein
MNTCASKNLEEEDFTEVRNAILEGDALDAQLETALESFPMVFHMCLLPDIKTIAGMEDMEEVGESLLREAEKAEWEARLTNFLAMLAVDQLALQRTAKGHWPRTLCNNKPVTSEACSRHLPNTHLIKTDVSNAWPMPVSGFLFRSGKSRQPKPDCWFRSSRTSICPF